mmetsp:Transcript_153822/g.271469  ORF Transcript_153822/g.271469 Transcript_153822/m.271469 type:complete len:227 (+) Transcript_153822:359-1039(+)
MTLPWRSTSGLMRTSLRARGRMRLRTRRKRQNARQWLAGRNNPQRCQLFRNPWKNLTQAARPLLEVENLRKLETRLPAQAAAECQCSRRQGRRLGHVHQPVMALRSLEMAASEMRKPESSEVQHRRQEDEPQMRAELPYHRSPRDQRAAFLKMAHHTAAGWSCLQQEGPILLSRITVRSGMPSATSHTQPGIVDTAGARAARKEAMCRCCQQKLMESVLDRDRVAT